MDMAKPSSKNLNPPSAPYPTAAQSDYIQNGLVLPKDAKHLEILLRDVHQKGFFDIELCYQLRQREGLKDVEQRISKQLDLQQRGGNERRRKSVLGGNGFVRMVEECLSA
jgi:hypothetical protein